MIGVLNKIKSQLVCLEDLFNEISFLSLSKDKVVISVLKKREFVNSKILNAATSENDFSIFWAEAKRQVEQDIYHVVFFRYDISNQNYPFIDFIKSTENLYSKILCEIPTYPFYDELKDKKNINFEKGVVKQISANCGYILSPSSVKSIYGKKVLTFENSSNVSELYTFNKKDDLKKFKFLIIANASSWHGIERILHGAINHSARNLKIDIFGNGNETTQLYSLVDALKIGSKVEFHKSRDLYFFEKNRNDWHMGISSIGLHRTNCKNAKPIKARDYIALGLPIVCTMEDRVMAEKKFNFTVPSDESKVNLNSVISHYKNLDENSTKDEMLDFAKSYLNWNSFRDKIREIITSS